MMTDHAIIAPSAAGSWKPATLWLISIAGALGLALLYPSGCSTTGRAKLDAGTTPDLRVAPDMASPGCDVCDWSKDIPAGTLCCAQTARPA